MVLLLGMWSGHALIGGLWSIVLILELISNPVQKLHLKD